MFWMTEKPLGDLAFFYLLRTFQGVPSDQAYADCLDRWVKYRGQKNFWRGESFSDEQKIVGGDSVSPP